MRHDERVTLEIVAARSTELLDLINSAAPTTRLRFVAYMLEMIHEEASASDETEAHLTKTGSSTQMENERR